MKRPSFQFYPGDWLQDSSLRSVSVGAQGLWINMLCLMHQSPKYGYLMAGCKVNHKVIPKVNLARITGATIDEVSTWMDELEQVGIFSKDEAGAIFSRRMIRDETIRNSRASGGFKGGNPSLLKVNHKDNLNHNHIDNLPLEGEDEEEEGTDPSLRGCKGKPTFEELAEECNRVQARKGTAEEFWHFYESNGWKVGKNKMVSWKSSLAGWIHRSASKAAPTKNAAQIRREQQAQREFPENITVKDI